MNGKATLILTDKDTGKIVRQAEEHNMVTNALSSILNVPALALLNLPTVNFYGKLLPLWQNLMSGVVLLGNTMEENADKFMIPPTVTPIGAAGAAYTGTNPMRGTFNTSQSGPIDNGYRLVWDFAPEKAVGTIRCIGLTNLLFANLGFSTDYSLSGMGLSTLPQNMDGTNASAVVTLVSVPGTFYGRVRNNDYYSFKFTSGSADVFLWVNRISDLSSIKIPDTAPDFLNPSTVSEINVTLPFAMTNVNLHFYNHTEDILYFFANTTDTTRTVNIFRYAGVNPETGKIVKSGSAQIPYITVSDNSVSFAVFNNKFYAAACTNTESRIYIFSASSGELIESRETDKSNSIDLYMFNGYLMASQNQSGSYFKFFADYPEYTKLCSDNLRQQTVNGISLPYAVRYNSNATTTNVMLILRTDYMATINNLSQPIEKTDRHALQIRYEITN